jgi:hypothetical protein
MPEFDKNETCGIHRENQSIFIAISYDKNEDFNIFLHCILSNYGHPGF